MATIKDLITEFRTIADAHLQITHFDYWDDNIPNSDRDKTYPALFINRNIEITTLDMTRNMPVYRIVFTFADVFHREAEANTFVNEDAQLELEQIYFQFWNEFKDRIRTTNADKWTVPNFSDGNYNFKVFDERLNTLVVTLEFPLTIDCVDGTFNYDS